jgi:hypothetical protein
MKKFPILLVMFLILASGSFAQLNPVGDLQWMQWYEMPNNYFRLTWSPPAASADTLEGYNVYRDDSLYRFQTETILNHEEYTGNCSEDFVFFQGGGSFYMHVTAVYNASHQESAYIDSVYSPGFAIGVEHKFNSKTALFPNPTTGLIKSNLRDIQTIVVYDAFGSQVMQSKRKSEINISGNPKGLYFIKVMTTQKEFFEKVLLQ